MSADVDYETEYNNRARVPENPAIIAGWSREAKAYREAHQARHKVISYGTGERNRIDLFSGDGTGPIVVFIHGGYWQALDGSFFSHLAGGLNAHGIDVAVPSYDLCPAVSIAEIIGQMRAASRELAKLGRPLVVSGHSAGGHLAACMRGSVPSAPKMESTSSRAGASRSAAGPAASAIAASFGARGSRTSIGRPCSSFAVT